MGSRSDPRQVDAEIERWIGQAFTRHRIGFALQAPTGRKGTLHGSGGWDTAALWQWRWATPRWAATASACLSILDGAGDLLGIDRDNIWYATGSYTHRHMQ